MSYLRDLCSLALVVSNTYSVVSLFCFYSSCVPYVASFSGLSVFDCTFAAVFSKVYVLSLIVIMLTLVYALVSAYIIS
jgi:hypothetical protein